MLASIVQGHAFHRRFACLLFLPLLASPALAGDLGFFEKRRLHNAADDALARGDAATAAELYQQLVDGLERAEDRRGEALYGAAVAVLASPALEEEGARAHLAELLEVFPGHERAAEARVLNALLEAPVPAAEVAPPVAEVDENAGVLEQLEAKVVRLESQLRAAREELKKKEEAIEKLKELVVGDEGG